MWKRGCSLLVDLPPSQPCYFVAPLSFLVNFFKTFQSLSHFLLGVRIMANTAVGRVGTNTVSALFVLHSDINGFQLVKQAFCTLQFCFSKTEDRTILLHGDDKIILTQQSSGSNDMIVCAWLDICWQVNPSLHLSVRPSFCRSHQHSQRVCSRLHQAIIDLLEGFLKNFLFPYIASSITVLKGFIQEKTTRSLLVSEMELSPSTNIPTGSATERKFVWVVTSN